MRTPSGCGRDVRASTPFTRAGRFAGTEITETLAGGFTVLSPGEEKVTTVTGPSAARPEMSPGARGRGSPRRGRRCAHTLPPGAQAGDTVRLRCELPWYHSTAVPSVVPYPTGRLGEVGRLAGRPPRASDHRVSRGPCQRTLALPHYFAG